MLPAHHAPNYAATPHAPRRTACSTLHRPPYPKPPPPFRGEFSSAYSEKISINPGTLSEDRSDAACRVVLSSPFLLLLRVPNLPNPPSKQGKPPLHPELSLGIRAAVQSSAIRSHALPNRQPSSPAWLETPPILPQGATPRAPAYAARSRHAESPRADEPTASQKPADDGSRASSLFGQISA